MLEPLLDALQGSPLALWGLFAILIFCGLGLPVPEDVVLITAGMVAAERDASWLQASLLMYIGVIGGDTVVFYLGRHFGSRLLNLAWTQRLFSPVKQARVRSLFDRYGAMVLFIARFLPGLRAPIFCTAGAMRVRYMKFLLLDGAAALLSVPLFVFIGYWLWRKFSDDLESLQHALSRAHSFSLGGALGLAAVVALAGWLWCRYRRSS